MKALFIIALIFCHIQFLSRAQVTTAPTTITSNPSTAPTTGTATPTRRPSMAPIRTPCTYLSDTTRLDVIFAVDMSCAPSGENDGAWCQQRQEMIAELMTAIKGADTTRTSNNLLSRVAYMEFGSDAAAASIKTEIDDTDYNRGPIHEGDILAYYGEISEGHFCGLYDTPQGTDLYHAIAKAQTHLYMHNRPNTVEKIVVFSECKDSGSNGDICDLWKERIKCSNNNCQSVTDLIFINLGDLATDDPGYGACLAKDEVFNYATIDTDTIVNDISGDICESPTPNPTTDPTTLPSWVPTTDPTASPSDPTASPSDVPSSNPSDRPSSNPSARPSTAPTINVNSARSIGNIGPMDTDADHYNNFKVFAIALVLILFGGSGFLTWCCLMRHDPRKKFQKVLDTSDDEAESEIVYFVK